MASRMPSSLAHSVSCNEAKEKGLMNMADTKNSEDLCEEENGGGVSSKFRWQVRPMRHEDIEKCLHIWLAVDLTESYLTVANALSVDPNGFYVAESNGKVIGMCSGTMADSDTAFMGFYGVAPEHQGKGIGRELWSRTTARLVRSACNIGLYGVPGMSEKYKKIGFKIEDTIRMLIFESQPGTHLDTHKLKSLNELQNEELIMLNFGGANSRTNKMETAAIVDKLIQYDMKVHKNSRELLLRNYFLDATEIPLTIAIVKKELPANKDKFLEQDEKKLSCCITTNLDDEKLSAKVENLLTISSENTCITEDTGSLPEGFNNSVMVAYGCLRHDNTGGAMIGPLYAQSSDLGEIILRQLIENSKMKQGGKYSVMSLTSNDKAAELLNRIGLQEMDQCTRMFTKFLPEAALEHIYYVHSPNFSLF